MKPPTILVVEDNDITRKMFRVTLERQGFAVVEAPDGATALAVTPSASPDLIIQDLQLPDIDGIELVARLRALPEACDIPILACSGFLSKVEEARAAQSGFTDYLFKPVEPSRLRQVVEAHLPARRGGQAGLGRGRSVLVADDDPMMRRVVTLHLERLGFSVVTAGDGVEALERARAERPDAIVADVLMPRLDGFRLCLAVRQDPRLARIPVVLTSAAFVEAEDQALGRRVGASAFVVRTHNFQEGIEAILATLEEEPPPLPVGPVDVLAEEYASRMVRQLERQLTLHHQVTRRLALREAELSVLGGLRDFASTLRPETAVRDMVLRALDAAAVSKGAAYLLDPGGSPVLHADFGYRDSDSRNLADCFGHADLLQRVIARGEPLVVPSGSAPAKAEIDLLARAGAESVLIAPIVAGEERLGAILMASNTRDLQGEWVGFARAVGGQVGQALVLLRAVSRVAAAEAKYRNIFENAVVGIVQVTPEGRLLTANARMAQILGYASVEELLAAVTDFGRQVHVDPGRCVECFGLLDAEGAVEAFESAARRKDGSVIFISLSARVRRDDTGRVELIEAIVEDITARRRAEEAVRESEERYRLIMENVTDAIFMVDTEGRLVFGNHSGEALTGYTQEEFVGRPIFSLLTPEGARVAMDRIARSTAGEKVSPILDAQIVRKDGGRVPVEAHITSVSKGGQVVGRLGVVRDVTERRRAEEALRLLESAVRQAGESIIVTTAELDLPGPKILFVNPAFTKLTGYTADEVIGRTPRILQGPLTDRATRHRLREDLAAGREFYGETINYRKDRTPFPIALHISPVRDEHGRVTHFIAIQRDLTEQRRVEEQLASQRDALYQSEKLGAMGQLLAGVAHELNNPLAVVIGHAMMLRRTAPPGFTERAAKISDAAERCGRIVKNFLALARQHPMERQEVDLNGVVRGAVELLAYPLRVDTVEVSLDLAGDLPGLWGDGDQLHQVIVNLISNAHYAMRETAPPRRLTIATRWRAGERLTLEVADSGPGIPAEIRSRIFEPFFTTKPAGQGTGLGLSLCRSIVERHRGAISVQSAPGQGATFRVELPLGAPPGDLGGGAAPAGSAPVRRCAILVVDDEPEVAELLAEMLAVDGHTVETAKNGAQALDKIRGGSYDIVFCDMRMPELDGPGLYREVERSQPGLLRRWIFLTGDVLGPETAEFLDRVRTPTLMKPFDPGELRRLVAEATARD